MQILRPITHSFGVLAAVLAFCAGSFGQAAASKATLKASRQLLLVTTANWDATTGSLQRFELAKPGAAWRPVGSTVPVVIGRTGLAWDSKQAPENGAPVKREGDGKSPAGVFAVGPSFGQSREKLSGLKLDYVFLNDDVECVDDVRSSYYNQLTSRRTAAHPDWDSSEKMWSQPLYKWGAVVPYNMAKPQPGAGSCIFLHIWGGETKPTAGCTAMAESNLTEVLRWLDPKKKPAIVQLPEAEYQRLKAGWQLP